MLATCAGLASQLDRRSLDIMDAYDPTGTLLIPIANLLLSFAVQGTAAETGPLDQDLLQYVPLQYLDPVLLGEKMLDTACSQSARQLHNFCLLAHLAASRGAHAPRSHSAAAREAWQDADVEAVCGSDPAADLVPGSLDVDAGRRVRAARALIRARQSV